MGYETFLTTIDLILGCGVYEQCSRLELFFILEQATALVFCGVVLTGFIIATFLELVMTVTIYAGNGLAFEVLACRRWLTRFIENTVVVGALTAFALLPVLIL